MRMQPWRWKASARRLEGVYDWSIDLVKLRKPNHERISQLGNEVNCNVVSLAGRTRSPIVGR
jgi:hypothetical protein